MAIGKRISELGDAPSELSETSWHLIEMNDVTYRVSQAQLVLI
jgi:hypothetical protein